MEVVWQFPNLTGCSDKNFRVIKITCFPIPSNTTCPINTNSIRNIALIKQLIVFTFEYVLLLFFAHENPNNVCY